VNPSSVELSVDVVTVIIVKISTDSVFHEPITMEERRNMTHASRRRFAVLGTWKGVDAARASPKPRVGLPLIFETPLASVVEIRSKLV
jgi:hypothetical protein